ncbi:hypothetical protein [Actinomadura macrotermitis]|uniref:Uncharacterized protein n=1 Tax=Actinomadura macrotermitis TaxID=2585200 RepID=A0A7K0BVX3_9ACTN|nr:hypothetical protein [Actinomadura macrotermitis]MQY05318.1 hypothetical protein [Actinomadura macrotermitis]
MGGNIFYDSGSYGSAGKGQVVRNNSASMGNHTANCLVSTYISTSFTGDYDTLHVGWAGNLSDDEFWNGQMTINGLHNDNASIRAYNCV